MSSESQPATEVPAHVLDYLAERHTLTLATASPGGVPRASTFLYVNDGPAIYFWARPDATTARHVEQNSLVSFAIDEYAADLRQTRGVQGIGECRVLLSGEEIARVASLFGDKFPDLSPGNTMSISFFRVTPTDIQFIDNTKGGAEVGGGAFGAEFHRERAYSVFADLPLRFSESIAAPLQKIQVDAGEVVVRQGGPADKFFILVDGEVEIVREQNGESKTLATLGEGQFFGEVAILHNVPRAGTVRATKPTTLFAMERDTFRDLVAQSLGTTGEFEQVIHERLDSFGGGS